LTAGAEQPISGGVSFAGSPSDSAVTTLSEHDSKRLLAEFGVAVAREELCPTPDAAAAAARRIGFPVALKLCGDAIAHKTERDLVRLGLGDETALRAACADLLAKRRPEDGAAGLLVCEMVRGRIELIAGLVRDPVLGPCVMLGLGGILAEALADVVFAAVPLSRAEALRLPSRLRAAKLLREPLRGDPPVDPAALADVLLALSLLAERRPDVASVDLNPLIVRAGKPIAVDALVALGTSAPAPRSTPRSDAAAALARFRPLFEPRGVVVAGASSHPGKFGFVALHNLLRFGYAGEVFAINRDGNDVLGRPTLRDIAEVPAGRADLLFVCTPRDANLPLVRAAAERGVRAAFVASGGYSESGAEGAAAERALVAEAERLGVLLVGPNGQGLISTPASMCAQIVAPFPPRGRIAIASQSGNLVTSLLHYAVESGIGVSRAVSCGNSASTGIADFLDYFATDPETAVGLVYLEGIRDGEKFLAALRRFTPRKPLVVIKGGARAEGMRAAASHTGSLASDDRIVDGILRQHGAVRAPTVEEGFEWAATFATQPLPRGRRTVVFTTVGGWGVLAADACSAAGLELVPLPKDVVERIDAWVPARWSRNNPIDLAGGETRDTIPQVLDLLCAHEDVDAVIHLGLGIQSDSANALKTGRFYPDFGLERIVAFHERQDRRYAQAGCESSERHAKPVLVASELAVTDRDYGNPGTREVRARGRLCLPSAHRAVSALRALADYAEYLASLR
jgi:acetyltransferase